MKPEHARQLLFELLGRQITFNQEFDDIFTLLKESIQEGFLSWCKDCMEGNAMGSVPAKRKCKDLFVFFRKIGDSTRAVLVKKQNSVFIEVHLVNHRDYDDIRLKLGYKKSSYYSS